MARGNYVSYLRVSTQKQGESGLGLEAQRKAVEDYLDGGRWTLLAEFIEVESGKREDRPKLTAALAYCKLTGARLVIAKLDRLSRDAHFLLGLQKAGVKFVAADLPEANEMVVGLLAVVAQAERKMISDRTKAALAAVKARGVKIGGWREAGVLRKDGTISKGSPKFGPQHHEAARRARQAASREHAQGLAPMITELRSRGITSLGGIARALEERGVLTASKKDSRWSPMQVSRVLSQLEAGR
jgi:DNA invertase Pin-like site-specific DNA recombinase